MSVDRYIDMLTLAQATLPPQQRLPFGVDPETKRSSPGLKDAPTPTPSSLQAAVNVGSLLSFVDGTSAEEKDDILFSIQLAQRGASGTFNRFTDTQSWYQKYLEILENVGWTTEQMAFAQYNQSEGEFRMDKTALAIITAIATQNQLAVLHESVKALSALAESDGTIRLFDFHTLAQKSGNFQIGAVQKAANGALAVALGAFHFSSNDARRRFLFSAWGAHQVEFWTAAQKMTLNTTLYARHRDAVQRKLGASSDGFIAQLNLERLV
jgi:hypothetical protein